MARCGRKRLYGHREPGGRLQRIKDAERRGRLGEMSQVASQPHRLGNDDPLCESAIGRFVLRNKLRRELYDGAIEYGGLVRHLHSAKLATKPVVSVGFGSGAGVTPEKAAWLQEELARIERPLRRLYPIGLTALQTLAVYEREVAPEAEPEAIIALCELGQLLRKVGR